MGNREEAVTTSDRALDLEIEQALAVQPSPEFVARLRTAVTAGPPARRQSPWIWIGAGAAGVAIAVVLLVGSVVAPERGDVPQPPQLAVSPHIASIPLNRIPEIPVLSLLDLGVVRGVELGPDGSVRVAVSPTYSGCPATAVIRRDIVQALRQAGFEKASAYDQLAPPWSSDWIIA